LRCSGREAPTYCGDVIPGPAGARAATQALDTPPLEPPSPSRIQARHHGTGEGADRERWLPPRPEQEVTRALRTGFAYYGAIGQDVTDIEARTEKLTMPTLAIGGGTSWGRGQEVARSLRQMAVDVTEEVYPECGHWVPEEKPVQLAASLCTFIQ
jgi:pimeloyl-ACP methyl ester carboxylesterase